MSSKYFLYNLPLKKDVVLHLNNLNPLTQGYVVPSLVEIGPVVLEKNLIYCDVLLLFHYQHSRSFEQTWIPFTQGCSVSKLAEIAWVGICGEEDFKMLSLYICYRIHLEKNPHGMNYFHIRRFCDKFGWNWLSDSWEEDENVKSLQARTDRQTTDNMQSERLTITFSSGELNNLAKYTPIK